jgi:hypothetical protein
VPDFLSLLEMIVVLHGSILANFLAQLGEASLVGYLKMRLFPSLYPVLFFHGFSFTTKFFFT